MEYDKKPPLKSHQSQFCYDSYPSNQPLTTTTLQSPISRNMMRKLLGDSVSNEGSFSTCVYNWLDGSWKVVYIGIWLKNKNKTPGKDDFWCKACESPRLWGSGFCVSWLSHFFFSIVRKKSYSQRYVINDLS